MGIQPGNGNWDCTWELGLEFGTGLVIAQGIGIWVCNWAFKLGIGPEIINCTWN